MEMSSLLALPDGLEVASATATDKLLTVRRHPHVQQVAFAHSVLVRQRMFAVITPVS